MNNKNKTHFKLIQSVNVNQVMQQISASAI